MKIAPLTDVVVVQLMQVSRKVWMESFHIPEIPHLWGQNLGLESGGGGEWGCMLYYETISPQDLRHPSFKRLPGCWSQHFLQLSFQDEAKVMKNSRTFSFLTWFVKIMVAAYQWVWLVCNCLRYFIKTDTSLSVQPTKVVNTNNSCEGMTIVKSVAQNKK